MDEEKEILNLWRDIRLNESLLLQLLTKLGMKQEEFDEMYEHAKEKSNRWVLDHFPGTYLTREEIR